MTSKVAPLLPFIMYVWGGLHCFESERGRLFDSELPVLVRDSQREEVGAAHLPHQTRKAQDSDW